MSRIVCFIDDEGMVGTCINEAEGDCDHCEHNDDAHKKFRQELKEKDMVTITCYRTTDTMPRKEAIDFYLKAMQCSEGSEQNRYLNIYLQLLGGEKECSDEG